MAKSVGLDKKRRNSKARKCRHHLEWRKDWTREVCVDQGLLACEPLSVNVRGYKKEPARYKSKEDEDNLSNRLWLFPKNLDHSELAIKTANWHCKGKASQWRHPSRLNCEAERVVPRKGYFHDQRHWKAERPHFRPVRQKQKHQYSGLRRLALHHKPLPSGRPQVWLTPLRSRNLLLALDYLLA